MKANVSNKTKMASNAVKPHHVKAEFCTTRARYREGRELKAVKVYTIAQESRYLLVQGIPSVGAHDDLLRMLALYGAVEEYRLLDEYPAEDFTDVMWVRFQKLPAARIAKRKMDNQSFYGGVLHVCFAPEYESVQDTREKIKERRKTIAARIRRLEAEEGHTTTTSTMASSEEWSYRPQQTTKQQHQQQASSSHIPPPHDYGGQHQHQHQAHQQQHQHQQSHQQNQANQQQQHHQRNQQQQQQQQQSTCTGAWQAPYPALPPPPQYSAATCGGYPRAARGGPVTNPDTRRQDTPGGASMMGSDSNNSTGEGLIIRPFQHRTVPKFVPRQLRDPGRKPLIKRHLLGRGRATRGGGEASVNVAKDNVGGEKDLEQEGAKAGVEKAAADSVNADLRLESCVLRDVQGPQLPQDVQERRATFSTTETGCESVDLTVAAIRKRVHEFSVIAPPPQLKRKKKAT